MPVPPRWLCLVFSLIALRAAGAAELVMRDLILNLEFLPARYDYTISDSNGEREGSDEFDSAMGLAVGGRYSFAGPGDSHGFIVGGELCLAQYASSAPDGHLTTYGARVEGGYGWAVSDRWTVAALADLGYALATYDIASGSAFPSFSASGNALSYGAGVSVEFAVTERVLVGLDLGYQIRTLGLAGNGLDIELDQAGIRAAIGLTYRFSARPRPLE